MMRLFVIVSLLVFASASLVYACEPSYGLTENITIFDTIISSGEGASCAISIYNSTSIVIENGSMDVSGLLYSYAAGNLSKGAYTAPISCSLGNVSYVSSCNFEVEEVDTMLGVLILIIPLLLFLFFIVGAVSLNAEKHPVLKIGLYLLSIIPFYIASWFTALVVIEYYGFTDLVNALADIVFWSSLIYFVIVSYFIIYAIYTLYNNFLAKKKEELNY